MKDCILLQLLTGVKKLRDEVGARKLFQKSKSFLSFISLIHRYLCFFISDARNIRIKEWVEIFTIFAVPNLNMKTCTVCYGVVSKVRTNPFRFTISSFKTISISVECRVRLTALFGGDFFGEVVTTVDGRHEVITVQKDNFQGLQWV